MMSGYNRSSDSYQDLDAGRGNGDIGSEEKEKTRKDNVLNLYFTTVNYDLFISKVFYLFFFSAFGSLFPLIAVYFKQLGMNATQAGILLGIRPFVEYISAPFWGRFADRFKKGKLLLLASLFCWIAFTVSLAFIQPLPVYCVASNNTIEAAHRVKREIPPIDGVDPSEYKINPERTTFRIRHKPGIAPIEMNAKTAPNYNPAFGDLVRPPFSTKVYRRAGVEEVFLLLLLLTIIGVFFSSPALSLADACTLEALGDHPELYGKQRLFGSIGWGIAMFFVGIALDYSTAGFSTHPCRLLDTGEKNYTLCFATFSVLMMMALITATQFRFTYDDRPDVIPQKIMDINVAKVAPAVAENVRARAPEPQQSSVGPKWLSVLKTFSSPHYAAFLVVTLCFGFGIGQVFGFLFWHLQDIGGSSSLFGIASVVNHVSEVLAFFFSFRLINAVGHMRVLYLGLLVNCARFLYVSWLTDPWWVLPFEFVQGLTHSIVYSAITSYVSLVTEGFVYKTTAQSVVESLHMGMGRGIGTLVSGIIITYTGTQVVFRAYGIVCLAMVVIFFGINRYFKADGIKYQASDLLEDSAALAPHGAPAKIHFSSDNIANNVPQDYGTVYDPTQEAYDRYVQPESYDKPVNFERIDFPVGRRN